MNRRVILGAFFLLLVIGVKGKANDVPGALVRTAEGLPPATYELMLSPQYLFNGGGSYLSSELRYQPNEALGVGFGFGSGEIGYHFGAHGVWHILPDLAAQPAFSVMAGLYFNRVSPSNFFSVRVVPMVSETLITTWGHITPYGGMQFSPSFRLGETDSTFSLRATLGTQFIFNALRGLNLWVEVGVNVMDSVNQAALGISYPFSDFGG